MYLTKFISSKLCYLILLSISFSGISLNSYMPIKINGNINIDGRLDELEWNQAPVISDFIILNSNKDSDKYPETELRILYDDHSLYVGAILYDDMSSVSHKRGENDDFDNVFYENSDYFIVEIDSYHDHQSSYGFGVNVSGVMSDYAIYDNEFFNDYWDGDWQSSVVYSDDSWIIEYEIPIKNLRFENEVNLTMGINFIRYSKADNAYLSWTNLPQLESEGIVLHYGHLEGLNLLWKEDKISFSSSIYTQNIEYNDRFYSYNLVDGNVNGLDIESDPEHYIGSYIENNIGLDIKYLISSNATLDFTLNPEFYVEQDPSEINNSAYETYFEEKRPFFIEQSQIFITPIEIFYSRRIGDENFRYFYEDDNGEIKYAELESKVAGALKLSGRKNTGFSYGLILAQSRIDNSYFQMDKNNVLYSIFRLKKEMFYGKSYIGLIGSNFDFEDLYSNVFAIDGIFDFNEYGLEFSYQYAKSVVENNEGFASTYELDYNSKSMNLPGNDNEFYIESWIKYDNFDKSFNIDHLGYIYRNDIKGMDLGLGFYFFNENIFDISSLSFKSSYSKNYNNVILEDIASIDWKAKLLNNWSVQIGVSRNNVSYLDRLYSDYFQDAYLENSDQRNVKVPPQKNYYIGFDTDLRKRVSFSTVINYFNSYDKCTESDDGVCDSIDDDGFSRILKSKIKLTNAVDVEFIIDDLNYYKTYQFLKIRKINLPNGGGDEMSFFHPREDYRYLFTNSKNTQNAYIIRMNAFMKKKLSINFYVEYFNYENDWDEDSFSYIQPTTEQFSYPEEHPNYTGNHEEDILLYSAKYSSLSYNIIFDAIIKENYFITMGIQYNKGINGRNFYDPRDIIQFDESNFSDSDKAEIFYDSTLFFSLNMMIGN